jgi:hypothetical protein
MDLDKTELVGLPHDLIVLTSMLNLRTEDTTAALYVGVEVEFLLGAGSRGLELCTS